MLLRILLCSFFVFRLVANVTAQEIPALVPYRQGDKWGYADSTGKIVIAPQWDMAEWFAGSRAVTGVYHPNSNTFTYCVIDNKGNYIIPPSRNWNRRWSGWLKTNLNSYDSLGRYGLIDTNNNLLIPYEYDMPLYPPSFSFGQNKAVIRNRKIGLINKSNELVIPFEFDMIEQVVNADTLHLAFKALKKSKWWLFDAEGTLIHAKSFDVIMQNQYATITQQMRKGVKVGNYRFVNGIDSSKGMEVAYGWVDYPKGIYIKPKYRRLDFLSDQYYYADEYLYQENGKFALKTGGGFFKRNDSTIVYAKQKTITNDKEGLNDSIETTTLTLNLANLAVVDSTVERTKLTYTSYGYGNSYGCGTGAYEARRMEAEEAARPVVKIGDSLVKLLHYEGKDWYTRKRLHTGQITVESYPDYWQGLVDYNGKFLHRPIQEKLLIEACNEKDELLVFNKKHQNGRLNYSVSDLRNNTLLNADSGKVIYYAFKESGQLFTIIRTFEKTAKAIIWDDDGRYINNSYKTQICDSLCLPLPALISYNFKSFVDDDLNSSLHYSGVIKVTDSLDRFGYVNLKGETLFPEISFKYKSLQTQNNQLFLVSNGNQHPQRLVDKNNVDIFPGKEVKYVRAINKATYPKGYTPELFQLPSTNGIALFQVFFVSTARNYYNDYVYISFAGKVYGTNLTE